VKKKELKMDGEDGNFSPEPTKLDPINNSLEYLLVKKWRIL